MALVRRLVVRTARAVRGTCGSGAAAERADGGGAAERADGGDAAERADGGDAAGGVWPRCVVSGLQPTGALHVGNYFGALRRCVRAQERGEDVVLFVADLHALTAARAVGSAAGAGLEERSLCAATLALAAGVDPARSVLFVQSAVPRHAELCWLLACLTSPERLSHLPQYRERSAGGGSGTGGGAGLGVLLYPVLQAADVLLYRGTHVPTGADQVPHLQLAAQLARAFNRRYGRAFPEPRVWLPEDDADRIRSLRTPERKMSKSDPDPKSRVLLTDGDDAIRRKLRKAVTDFTPRVTFEPERRPGVSNLVRLHCLAADRTPEEVVEECDSLTTAQYKEVVAEALIAALSPLRARAARLAARPGAVRAALRLGAARARARADAVYGHAARLAGLTCALPPPALLRPAQPSSESAEITKQTDKSDEIQASKNIQ